MEKEQIIVTHRPDENRFVVYKDGQLAELDYSLDGQVILFTHTGVPSALGGQGIGSQLVREGLEYAREKGLKVISRCWFVSGFIQRHPEYQDMLR